MGCNQAATGCDEKPIEDTLMQWVEGLIANSKLSVEEIALINGGCVTQDLEIAANEIKRLRKDQDRLHGIYLESIASFENHIEGLKREIARLIEVYAPHERKEALRKETGLK